MTTFLAIAQAACDAIGIERPTSITGSSGATEKAIVAMANIGGKALARQHDWTVLQKEHTFDVVNGTAEYNLPSDFVRFIDGTAWDRDNYESMHGPMTPQQWQVAKSGIVAPTAPFKRWRIKRASSGNTATFYIEPTPDNSTDSLVFEYISKNWCASTGGTPQEAWGVDTDVNILDDYLLQLDLIWRMKHFLGLAYQEEAQQFEDEASKAYARDGGAPALSITRPRFSLPYPGFVDGTIGL